MASDKNRKGVDGGFAPRTMASERALTERIAEAVTVAGYDLPPGAPLPPDIEEAVGRDTGQFRFPAATFLAERRRRESAERRRSVTKP